MVWQTLTAGLARIEVITGRRFNESDGHVICDSMNRDGVTDSEFSYSINELESVERLPKDFNLIAFMKSRIMEKRKSEEKKNAERFPSDPYEFENKGHLSNILIRASSIFSSKTGDYGRWVEWFNGQIERLEGKELNEFLKTQHKKLSYSDEIKKDMNNYSELTKEISK